MRRNVISIIRYQRVLALRQDGKTLQEIADDLGVSRQRIHQIHQRALKRISRTLARGNYGMRQTQAA